MPLINMTEETLQSLLQGLNDKNNQIVELKNQAKANADLMTESAYALVNLELNLLASKQREQEAVEKLKIATENANNMQVRAQQAESKIAALENENNALKNSLNELQNKRKSPPNESSKEQNSNNKKQKTQTENSASITSNSNNNILVCRDDPFFTEDPSLDVLKGLDTNSNNVEELEPELNTHSLHSHSSFLFFSASHNLISPLVSPQTSPQKNRLRNNF